MGKVFRHTCPLNLLLFWALGIVQYLPTPDLAAAPARHHSTAVYKASPYINAACTVVESWFNSQ